MLLAGTCPYFVAEVLGIWPKCPIFKLYSLSNVQGTEHGCGKNKMNSGG